MAVLSYSIHSAFFKKFYDDENGQLMKFREADRHFGDRIFTETIIQEAERRFSYLILFLLEIW